MDDAFIVGGFESLGGRSVPSAGDLSNPVKCAC